METNLNNLYVFRALEAYPYELEKAVEALNYALSQDPENANRQENIGQQFAWRLFRRERGIQHIITDASRFKRSPRGLIGQRYASRTE